MIQRCYLDITNVCNLNCAFCPKTDRAKRFMSGEEFDQLTDKLQGEVKFLYFHLMGEPFLHPELPNFIAKARAKGFVPVLTTNGTLVNKAESVIEALPYKIQISLHSQEGNGKVDVAEYVNDVVSFAEKAAEKGIIIVLRLWNEGGQDTANDKILDIIGARHELTRLTRDNGWKVADNIYIEYDRMFEWPDSEREEIESKEVFCYALRNQVGVLVDGSVVPCCLDHAGDIVLGNLFEQSLEDIVASPRAKAIYDGFTSHIAVEDLCKRCGYASITKKYRQ